MNCSAFIVMPFDEQLKGVFLALSTALQANGFDAIRADTSLNQQNVMRDVVVPLANSDLVVADMTGLNPNVMYEVGLAHALDRPVIMITQSIDELPFDLRSYRVLEYSPIVGFFDDFVTAFDDLLDQLGSATFGSPISDHLDGRGSPRLDCGNLSDLAVPTEESGVGKEIGDIQLLWRPSESTLAAVAATSRALSEVSQAAGSGEGALRNIFAHPGSRSQRPIIRALTQVRQRLDLSSEILAENWHRIEFEVLQLLDLSPVEIAPESRTTVDEFLSELMSWGLIAGETVALIDQYQSRMLDQRHPEARVSKEIAATSQTLWELRGVISRIQATAVRAQQFLGRLQDALDSE